MPLRIQANAAPAAPSDALRDARRRKLMFALPGSALFLSPALLVGCGGGGDGVAAGGGTSQGLRTTVDLPSGFSLPESELESGTAFGSDTVRNGSTSVTVPAAGPTFAYLRHKPTGKFIVWGLVDTGRARLGPLSSAVAAMALYFGWTGYTGAARTAAIALLEQDPAVQALGRSIEAAIATDPHAIVNGNASVMAAMGTAIAALRAGSAAGQSARRARALAAAPMIQVTPSDEQGGARVDQGDDGAVVPTNLKRRPVAFYTYLTGHDPAASMTVDLVDQQDVLPTGTFLGAIASLGEKPAWAPLPGQAVALPVPGDDDRTFYETVALMGTFDNAPADPAFFSDPKYAGEVAAWRTKLEELRVFSCLHSVGSDVFAAASLGGGAALTYATAQAIRAQITLIASDAAAAVIAKAVSGAYGEYLQSLMTSISEEYYAFYTAGSTAWRRVGLRLVGLAEAEAEAAALAEAGSTIASIAFLFAAALAAAGGVVAVVDLGASYSDTLASPLGVQWAETSLKARVRLSPETLTVAPDQSVMLSTALVGLGGSTGVTYRYTLTGSDLANLGDGKGQIGRSFDTDSSTVNLVTTPSTQGDLLVTVEAFRSGASLGKATSTISVVPQAYTVLTITSVGDGTLTVSRNGQQVGTTMNGYVGPFAAGPGDVFTVVLSGSTTRNAGVGGIVYEKPDGSRVRVYPGLTQTSPYPNPQLDLSFTIES